MNKCHAYCNDQGFYMPSIRCSFMLHCCKQPNNSERFCCSNEALKLDDRINTNTCFCTNESCVWASWSPLIIMTSIFILVIFILWLLTTVWKRQLKEIQQRTMSKVNENNAGLPRYESLFGLNDNTINSVDLSKLIHAPIPFEINQEPTNNSNTPPPSYQSYCRLHNI